MEGKMKNNNQISEKNKHHRKLVFSIVIHVARGNRIALHLHLLFLPAFTEIDMTLLKGKIAESTLLGIPMGKYDGLTGKLWSSTQSSVQVRVWKRFNELQPKPNLMKSGYPRLARWDKLKQKVENVSLILDSAKESFSSGKLGFPQVSWRKTNVGDCWF
ncbi:hypothetical protein H0E87_000302 [Populus deltoides]|uniref:Uncharacterized protein n=1 Tax=Populus deltoides TaxID=3696 RepID=A0A8T2ZM76_POPDE|nr:hypothetical protein H0E87_000302 [Populus deltoides]